MLALSVTVHAVSVGALGLPFSKTPAHKVEERLQIAFLRKSVLLEQKKIPALAPRTPTITRHEPVKSTEEARPLEPVLKKMTTVLSDEKKAPAQTPPREAVAGSAKTEGIKTSTELLIDPQRGRIFQSYFGVIKQDIERVVRRKYSHDSVSDGSVTLIFILRSDGRLEDIWVEEKSSTPDIILRNFAKNCVRDAAPFPGFPPQIDLKKISFSVDLSFE